VQELELALVFCNQKRTVDEVAEKLRERGFPAEALHGDLPQAARNIVMNRFRNGGLNLLVATDVAARGIDVDDVDAVINYDMPYDPEVYVHRIGRTGRAGRSGKAFSLVTGGERRRLWDISRYTKVEVERMPVPTFQDVVRTRRRKFSERVLKTIEAGGLEPFEGLLPKLQESGHSIEQVVAALVKLNFGEIKNDYVQESIDAGTDRKSSGAREFPRKQDFKPATKSKGGYAERPMQKTERYDKKSGKPYPAGRSGQMTRLVINIGKNEKISPSNIVGAIAGESGIPGSVLGQIDIHERHTSVDVPATLVSEVLRGMSGAKIKGKKVKISVEN
jgi:ATP-dependent RNA helicase DeaD